MKKKELLEVCQGYRTIENDLVNCDKFYFMNEWRSKYDFNHKKIDNYNNKTSVMCPSCLGMTLVYLWSREK